MLRPEHKLMTLIQNNIGVFTLKRWLRLPTQYHLGWIGANRFWQPDFGMLREPTAVPKLWADSLKPGYHWPENIH